MTTLVAPGGIEIYGGVGPFTARSADGSIYVVYCGERPGYKFGTHIYRILPNGTPEWVEYAPFTEGRVDANVEPDGLYISFGVGNPQRRPERVKVAGFVTSSFPGGTNYPPPSPVVVAAQDSTARELANAARSYAAEEIKRLKDTIKSLEARLVAEEQKPSGGVTEQQARDIAWELAEKRVYAELNGYNNPVKNLLETIIRRIIKTG